MKEIRISSLSIILLAIAVALGFYALNLKDKLREAENTIQAYKEDQEGKKINKQFIEKFFVFKTSGDRYKNIKSLTTPDGYHSTFPSGDETELPRDIPMESSIKSLKSYQYQKETEKMEFFNEFEVTTTYNKVSNVQDVVVKTILALNENGDWKVANMVFLGEISSSLE